MEGRATRASRASERILPNYRLGRILGVGSFAEVRLAEHVLTGDKVAVKILKRRTMTESETEKVMREIKLLKRFVHPHIIRLYDVIETRSKIYIVMEYIDCGELYYYITEKGKVEDDEARFFFQQIISGIGFCHLNMVVHRDLKPENLLLDSKRNIKIADFGLGNVMRDGHFLKTSCGSPNYAAPEVISGQLYAGPEVDVWSCGVILYVLLCGRLPFDSENFPDLFKKIKNGVYILPSHLSAGARDLILRILVVDPMKRITIPEIRQHPWFQNNLPRQLAVLAIESMQGAKKECMYTSPHVSDPTSSITVHNLQQKEYMGYQVLSRQQSPTEQRKWTLGIQFRAPPSEIMIEILSALKRLNVCWKKLGHYNMKCRWLPSFPRHMNGTSTYEPAILETDGVITTSDNAVKFEMQLYKAMDEKYLLDLQRLNGPPFLFQEICAAILSQFVSHALLCIS